MSYQVSQLIEGKGKPICVKRDDGVAVALALMIEHDFSQLPVIQQANDLEIPDGMITYEGILRGIRNFRLKIEDLKVRDVMVEAKSFFMTDDLFDILDQLKNTNAVLIKSDENSELVGILTSYDTTEYFRNRTEDLMRVEYMEATIKELIGEAYFDSDGGTNSEKLSQSISRISRGSNDGQPKTFDKLTLGEYINLLTLSETWDFFQKIFNLSRDAVRELLNGVREIRNSLAHFRGEITAEQRDKLKFGEDWLARCYEEYQGIKRQQESLRLIELFKKRGSVQKSMSIQEEPVQYNILSSNSSTDFEVTDSALRGGRYATLADWLQSQPGRIDEISLTFNQIEEIIGSELPASARNHRAWWANDSVGHSHSQLWLDAGWRRTYLNLSDGKVTFARIREREKAYISFFSRLLDDLRKKADFHVREISPDGTSWIVLQPIPRSGQSFGSFSFSFSREKRLRVELYLDLLDKEKTKSAFDQLFAQKEYFESQVGEIEWERLDNRRASRLALYKEGQISDEKRHVELRKWAIENMIKFFNTMVEPTEKAIREAIKANAT